MKKFKKPTKVKTLIKDTILTFKKNKNPTLKEVL